MSRGTRVISIDPDQDRSETAIPAEPPEDILSLDASLAVEEEIVPPPARHEWMFPAIAGGIIFGWTIIFAWAHWGDLAAGVTASQWMSWIPTWSAPVLIVIALWLVAVRSSRREAVRFSDAARTLSVESVRLETRLATVNRELSLAREFLASQTREIDALGRIAAERLSQHAERLASLVQDNTQQVESIASVSSKALENMNKLRGDLPVIANSARDVTNQIGNAGRSARNQLDELISGFHRLNEFGEASERQVQSLRVQVDAALAAFDAQVSKLDDIASGRFVKLAERSEAFRAQLDSQEAEAIAAIHRRADALAEELEAVRATLRDQEAESLDAFHNRLAAMREEGGKISAGIRESEHHAIEIWRESVAKVERYIHDAMNEVSRLDAEALERSEAQVAAFGSRIGEITAAEAERNRVATEAGEALAGNLEQLNRKIEAFAARSDAIQENLAQRIVALLENLAVSQDTIARTDGAVANLTDSSIRLLEIIQAGAQHSGEQLPAAIGVAETRLSDLVSRTEAVQVMLNEAGSKGEELSNYVLSAHKEGSAALAEMETLHARLAEHNEDHQAFVTHLRAEFGHIVEECNTLANRAQDDLKTSIAALEEAARGVVAELETGSTEAVAKLTRRISEESGEAIDRALRKTVAESVGQIEQAAAHASGVSREAAVQLRDHLAKVDELTGNLERRVAHARQRAEEQVDNDFARRVALISESLNSNAIDISKALSNEISDTAWASYLRGDRGIFTRRAVSLLDNADARAIAQIYEEDADFRSHVRRYIHDFESMLRQLLSTRDGHALSVTLLSSDMGKLYVALAQAIERLRN